MIRLSQYLPTVKEADESIRESLFGRTKPYLIAPAFSNAYATWYVHEGDLFVPCDVYNDVNLVVFGDLIVYGTYDDYVGVNTGSIACFGSMRADNVFSWGAIYIERDLLVDGVVHSVYNDHSFEVLGTVYAQALLLDDKSTNDLKYDCQIFASDRSMDSKALVRAVKQCRKVFPQLAWPADVDGETDRLPDFDRMRAFCYRSEKLFEHAKKSRFRKAVTANGDYRKQLALRDTAPELLSELFGSEEYQFDVAAHPACSIELQRRFCSCAERLRRAIASNPQAHADVLAELVKDSADAVRAAVAMNPATPPSLLEELAADSSSVVASALLKRKRGYEKIEICLPSFDEFRRRDAELRERAETSDAGPDFAELERLLLNSNSVSTRKEIAEAAINSHGHFGEFHAVRDKVLEKLMLDPSPAVRQIAACAWLGQKFYDDNEQRFLFDEAPDVRFVFALRTRSSAALRKLRQDENCEVRCAALMNPNMPEEVLCEFAENLCDFGYSEDELNELIVSVLQNVRLPEFIIEKLYQSHPHELLARHVNAPASVVANQIRKEAAGDSTLAGAVQSMKSDQDIFQILADSEEISFQSIAACNRHTPPSAIGKLMKKSLRDTSLSAAIAANPGLTGEQFEKLAKRNARVRISLANNPACPVELLKRLAAEDDSDAVKQAAGLTLQKLHGALL